MADDARHVRNYQREHRRRVKDGDPPTLGTLVYHQPETFEKLAIQFLSLQSESDRVKIRITLAALSDPVQAFNFGLALGAAIGVQVGTAVEEDD